MCDLRRLKRIRANYKEIILVYCVSINYGNFSINGPTRQSIRPRAGSPPPELAGRDEIIERAAVALDRIRAKRAARSLILYGLPGQQPSKL